MPDPPCALNPMRFESCAQEAEVADKAAAVVRAQQQASDLQSKLKVAEQQLSAAQMEVAALKARTSSLESEVNRGAGRCTALAVVPPRLLYRPRCCTALTGVPP